MEQILLALQEELTNVTVPPLHKLHAMHLFCDLFHHTLRRCQPYLPIFQQASLSFLSFLYSMHGRELGPCLDGMVSIWQRDAVFDPDFLQQLRQQAHTPAPVGPFMPSFAQHIPQPQLLPKQQQPLPARTGGALVGTG